MQGTPGATGASSQNSSGNAGGQQRGNQQQQNSGGQQFDIGEFAQQYGSALESVRNESRGLVQEQNERFQKALKVLSGEGDSGEQAGQEQNWFQDLIVDFLEAEKQGLDLPISKKQVMVLKKLWDRVQNVDSEMAELKRMKAEMDDPDQRANMSAYDKIDAFLSDGILDLWGTENPEVHSAVTQKIVRYLKALINESPDDWRTIRRNPNALQKIVMHFINETIPKAHRNLLDNVVDAHTEITPEMAWAAMKEAEEIEDPRLREQATALARQRYLELRYGRRQR